MRRGRNDIILVDPGSGMPGHFRLREFENRDGLAIVHIDTLWALERVRERLNALAGEEVWVIITDAARTQADLQKLADRLGWIDQGGAVSRDSKHLVKHGGIAVDIVAVIASSRQRFPKETLGRICREYFDYMKDDYPDGHIHADNRDGCKAREGTGRKG